MTNPHGENAGNGNGNGDGYGYGDGDGSSSIRPPAIEPQGGSESKSLTCR